MDLEQWSGRLHTCSFTLTLVEAVRCLEAPHFEFPRRHRRDAGASTDGLRPDDQFRLGGSLPLRVFSCVFATPDPILRAGILVGAQ